ncbi:MAG: hypothetical protein U1A77_11330 [Pirellulales bacterium]
MPARIRRDLVDPNEVGIYHCWSRCVRRLKFDGGDCGPLTENPERRYWFSQRLEALASVFAIEVHEYGVLDHTVNSLLTIRPDIAAGWSDEEVVRRWTRLSRKKLDLVVGELPEQEFKELVDNPHYVDDKRKRLSDLSWFMIMLKEPISLAANQEDGASGHAFAERFGCARLHSQEEILQVVTEIHAQSVSSGLAEPSELVGLSSYCDRWEDGQVCMGKNLVERESDAVQEAVGIELPDELDGKTSAEPRQTSCAVACEHDARTCLPKRSSCGRQSKCPEKVRRPKAGWMTPWGASGDGYDGVAAKRRLSNESHLAIDRELFDGVLKRCCQRVKNVVGVRVSVPAELPEELRRLDFDESRWADAYPRTARRFDRLARKAEGMRNDFLRVWNGGRVATDDERVAVRCRLTKDQADDAGKDRGGGCWASTQ